MIALQRYVLYRLYHNKILTLYIALEHPGRTQAYRSLFMESLYTEMQYKVKLPCCDGTLYLNRFPELLRMVPRTLIAPVICYVGTMYLYRFLDLLRWHPVFLSLPFCNSTPVLPTLTQPLRDKAIYSFISS
jgi:hypothetical protein